MKLSEIKTIELKNVKLLKSASDETPCYTATVHVNGKKAFEVKNHGTGGADYRVRIEPFVEEDIMVLDEWIKHRNKATAFLHKKGEAPSVVFHDLESWCHTTIWEEEHKKALKTGLKRNMKDRFVFVKKGDPKGIYESKKLTSHIILNTSHEAVIEQLNAEIVFNYIPFDEAFEMYCQRNPWTYSSSNSFMIEFMPEFDVDGNCTNVPLFE
jgi:hypothetical protein